MGSSPGAITLANRMEYLSIEFHSSPLSSTTNSCTTEVGTADSDGIPMNLILPGDPLFDLTLDTSISPDWRNVQNPTSGCVYMVKDSSSGLMRPATDSELNEYLYGGEYDEVMEDEYADDGED